MAINEMIEILNAYKEGKQIQWRQKGSDDVWETKTDPHYWNWLNIEYRIKPENNEKYEVGKKYLCTFKSDWEKNLVCGGYKSNDTIEMEFKEYENEIPYFKVTNLENCYFYFGSGCFSKIEKVQELRYRPYTDVVEFLDDIDKHPLRYNIKAKHWSSLFSGLWLQEKKSGSYFQITALYKDGIALGNSDEYYTWQSLFDEYTYTDGDEFGIKVDNENT